MLHFTSLNIENFGPFKGKQEIDFTTENGVTLIWGNNGLGKTTLLNIFRYALFGRVQGRGSKSHSLKQIANWESYEEGNYGFKVILKMVNDGVPYELTRQFSKKDNVLIPEINSDFEEVVFLKRDSAFLSKEEREHVINSIMPEQVSRFFLFDGELLQEYEDLFTQDNPTGEKIKEAIERILGVPVLTNGLADIRSAEKEYSIRWSKVAQQNKATQVIGNLLRVKQVELEHHEEELINLKTTLDQLTGTRHDLEVEIKQTEKVRELINERKLRNEIIGNKKEVLLVKKTEMKSLTKNAWQGMLSRRIIDALIQLEKEINQFEVIKNKHLITDQILAQIKVACNKGICPICEQDLSDKSRQTLKDKTESIVGFEGLSSEEHRKLIKLQGRRSQLSNLSTKENKIQVAAIETAIAEITVEISDAEQRISEINKNLLETGDQSRAITIAGEFATCLLKISNTETGINSETTITDNLMAEIKNLEDKLKQQSTDSELLKAERKRDLSEKVKKIFEGGVSLYRERLKKKVQDDASDIFLKIANQTEYTTLKINENYGLSIIHQSGRIVEIRSAGYEHIVALSLIGALHKNAPLQGPIIMDSPFGRLDPEHKKKITAALSTLAEQVILLVYSDEINEQLARSVLGGNLKNEYRLSCLTAFNTKIERA